MRTLLLLAAVLATATAYAATPDDNKPDINKGIVCGEDGQTYPNLQASQAAGTKVLHCGPCGACSNKHDIGVYIKTKDNITDLTTSCAWKIVFPRLAGGRPAATACMKEKVGLSDKCNECWMDNIECDQKLCVTKCIWARVMRKPNDLEKNECLKCDEEKCGPAFIKCAGANRRKSGIVSDIVRDPRDICSIIGK